MGTQGGQIHLLTELGSLLPFTVQFWITSEQTTVTPLLQ